MQINLIIVDDDKDTVEIFEDFLKFKGFNVLGVGHNGKDAVNLYDKFKPDVVLMDVMMPEYSGFYGLENIRKINPDAKVIMVTADLTEQTEEKLAELNASAVLYKPYEIDDVVNTINKVNRGEKLEKSEHTITPYSPLQN
ncbi:MAG: response regulator [Nitrosopumilaceae archaeon]